jgi:hypothetical protein
MKKEERRERRKEKDWEVSGTLYKRGRKGGRRTEEGRGRGGGRRERQDKAGLVYDLSLLLGGFGCMSSSRLWVGPWPWSQFCP